MKNYWLDKKEEKEKNTIRLKVDEKRRDAIKRALYGKKPIAGIRKSKPCGCNSKFIDEAKNLALRWEKTGLLDGIKDKHTRQVTAVLLEGQRLWNEQKYNLKVRTKKTEHRHGFGTLEELYRYLDMLRDDMKHYVTYSATGECQPADEQEMVLTIYENTLTDRGLEMKILHPKSAGGGWTNYDEWVHRSH